MNGSPPRSFTEDEIRHWLVDKLSRRLRIPPDEIDLDEPLVALGIDSLQFVALVGELEEWLGCRFVDNPLIDFPTVNALAPFLAEQLQQGKTQIDPLQG